jgi:hypothetical protein
MVVAWYVTRKQSQATLLQNTKRLRGNAYGMWLLMLMTSVKLFLFAVLIAICATTMWEVIVLIYVDKEDQQPQGDRLEYRSFLGFLTDVDFYRCAVAAVGTCLLVATAMILFYSTAKGRASTDDYAKEAMPYPEFYVLLYHDISSGLVMAWAIFYLARRMK